MPLRPVRAVLVSALAARLAGGNSRSCSQEGSEVSTSASLLLPVRLATCSSLLQDPDSQVDKSARLRSRSRG